MEEAYSVIVDDYTNEFKAELDEEYADYQKEGEVISKEEMDKAIENYCMESS